MPDEEAHWKLRRQLMALHEEMRFLVGKDPQHEVEGNAVSVIDELLEEAKAFVGTDDALIARVQGTFTVDAFDLGIKAADLEVVLAILIERIGHPPMRVRYDRNW